MTEENEEMRVISVPTFPAESPDPAAAEKLPPVLYLRYLPPKK